MRVSQFFLSTLKEAPAEAELASHRLMHGIATLVDDAADKRAIVEELTGRFESSRAAPWHLQLEGNRLKAMLGAIVGFRIAVTRVDAKFKMSQNRSAADRERVVSALNAESDADAIATAQWMSRR